MPSMHYSEGEGCRMFDGLIANYGEAVAVLLFAIGFGNLLLQKNLIYYLSICDYAH